MGKQVISGLKGRIGLKTGLDIVADAVKVTMGAKGLPVAMDRLFNNPPVVTKDGVSVAQEIQLDDPLHNMGANMIIQAASKTNDMAGDGTTTATVLTQAIVEQGMNIMQTERTSFYEMKRGMEYAVEKISENLRKNSIKIKGDKEKMLAIPTISANNNKELGQLIADTFEKVGEYGFISVEDSKTSKTYVDVAKGLKVKMTPDSHFMFQDTVNKKSDLSNVNVFLYLGRIETQEEIQQILASASPQHYGIDHRPLLIVCNEMNPLLLTQITTAVANQLFKVIVCKSPEIGLAREEAMEDIALVTGTVLYRQDKGDDPKNVTVQNLGVAEKVQLDEKYTSIISRQHQDKIEEKITALIEELEKTEDATDIEYFKERIARLKGGVARIYVGATSEMEAKEKKDRIVDAVNALTVAYKDGIVTGGGSALIRAAESIKIGKKHSNDFREGVEIIKKSVQYPIRQILKNAGQADKADEIIEKIKKSKTTGYNVVTNSYENFYKTGIIDPLNVTISALSNALSIATVFLSTETVIVDTTNWKEYMENVKFADGI